MKIIKSEGMFQVFSDGIETFDTLPARSYHLRFSDNKGFFLTTAEDVKNAEKVYGDLEEKADKVFKAYEKSDRSLGVLMSGKKGIGKTMMARILCERANQMGLPVIIVQFAKGGIAHFLGTIQQPVLILFDEFEKMFRTREMSEERAEAGGSPEMLSLLDGLYNEKWLFVFTCNNVYDVSSYLIGRPGRIHYHFKFNVPSEDEIRAYLLDKIPEEKHNQIQAVVNFSRYAEVNYDALRAIAFEFNLGNDFHDFIDDLNIDKKFTQCRSYVFVEFNSGMMVCGKGGTLEYYGGRDKHSWSLGGYKKDSMYTDSKRLVEFIFDEKFIVPDLDANDGTFKIDESKLDKCIARDASPREMEDPVIESVKSGVKSVKIIPDTDEFEGIIDSFRKLVVTYSEEEKDGDTIRSLIPPQLFHLPTA